MTTADEQAVTDTQAGYADTPIRRVTAENEIEYAYHDLGTGEVPFVLLQHFRANLDNLGQAAEFRGIDRGTGSPNGSLTGGQRPPSPSHIQPQRAS